MNNYYEMLNLDESFSADEIQDELSRLGNLWTRRLTSSPEKAITMLNLISNAYNVFKTEETKKTYDISLKTNPNICDFSKNEHNELTDYGEFENNSNKYCLSFEKGSLDKVDLIGERSANLAEMINIGIPVPCGFTITTDAFKEFFNDNEVINDKIMSEIISQITLMEKSTGKKFGVVCSNPLIISVRISSSVRRFGLMNAVLNLGLNDNIVDAMISDNQNPKYTRFVYDCYCRFIRMFACSVMNIDENVFERIIKKLFGNRNYHELSANELKELVVNYKSEYKNIVGDIFPSDPIVQLKLAVSAAFKSWKSSKAESYRIKNSISNDIGTAVNIMQMVFGNLNNESGAGNIFTRDCATGEKKIWGDFLKLSQGDEVIMGKRTPIPFDQMKNDFPKAYEDMIKICKLLECHFCDMQEIDFTIENGKLYILTCHKGSRTAQAAVKIACDFVDEGIVNEKKAALMVNKNDISKLIRPGFDSEELKYAVQIGSGTGASLGVACGRAVFNTDNLNNFDVFGEEVIVICNDELENEIITLKEVQGVITIHGGLCSDVAIAARSIDKCCICRCPETILSNIAEGDYISIDGSTGNIYEGVIPTKTELSEELSRVLCWLYTYDC